METEGKYIYTFTSRLSSFLVGSGKISFSLRPEGSENIPILLQEADLCFSKQNVIRNPKMGSKQSVVVATQ